METPFSGVGILSRIDPRVKITLFLVLAWTLAVADRIVQVLAFSPLVFLMFLPLIKEFKKAVKYLLFADFFLFFVVVTQFMFGSAYLGFLIFLKSTFIVAFSLLFVSTSSVFEILHALHHLGLPNKLLQLLFFFYRYLFSIYEQYQLSVKSAYSRGFVPKTGKQTYKTYAFLISNLLVKSYFKSRNVYKSLVSRGFSGFFPVYRHFSLGVKDVLFSILILTYWGIVLWKFYL